MNPTSIRSRWAAIGAAVAVSLGAGGIGISHATTSTGERPIYVPIEPCRLDDNRPGGIGADSSITLSGWGMVGDCDLPTGTTGLALNVTAVDATEQTNLRFYPADAPVPGTANLNPTPGAPPTPNAVNVDLDAAGEFKVYNRFGTVATVIDVMGYYDDHNHDDLYPSKTATIIVPPSAFGPVNPTIDAKTGNIYGAYVVDGTDTAALRAPLDLPVGSTITSITYYYTDNSAQSLSLDIVRTSLTANSQGFVPGLGIDTAGASASPRASTLAGLSFVVADDVELAIGAFNTNWTVVDNALAVKGVRIEYTLP